MFVRMLKLARGSARRHDLSTHRVAIHAAAPCPRQVKRAMIDWWGPIVHEYYAGSEGNGLCAINSADWLAHEGSVGRPVFGVPHILDDGGARAAAGAGGDDLFLRRRGVRLSQRSAARPRESRNALGWTTLGDIGYLDAEGFLYLTDRKANVIISGGVNIYPQETENLLVTHPKVMDVAVFGVPDEEFGEAVKAVVQPVDMREAGPELEQELIDYCREHLSHIKCPHSVDFEAELPRHADRQTLQAPAARSLLDRTRVTHRMNNASNTRSTRRSMAACWSPIPPRRGRWRASSRTSATTVSTPSRDATIPSCRWRLPPAAPAA